jgi:nucleoside phosphorylase
VALHYEAFVIIEYFDLTLVDNKRGIYENSVMALIISGIGTINSAIATTILATKYKARKIINIGIVGSKNSLLDIGKLFIVDKIVDLTTNSTYILNTSNTRKISLSSSPTPVDNGFNIKTDLVDMEASGFIEASLRFVPKDAIIIIKIISDHLKGEIPKKEFVKSLFSTNINTIKELIK